MRVLGSATDGEGNVFQSESFRSGAAGSVVVSRGVAQVFSWSHEPEERCDAQLDDMAIEVAISLVFCVQCVDDCSHQLDGGRVCPVGRFVIVSEFLEESSEKGMSDSHLLLSWAGSG